ncbi:hypothetical protein LIER_06022 [Lithospermum erythrorhizon]|uniref:RNase H type-1 domain-containing protein n=1 Tax=Lithospermum erythrorhizon TaxID=34254 RepID=A0AAV3P6T8_LITER
MGFSGNNLTPLEAEVDSLIICSTLCIIKGFSKLQIEVDSSQLGTKHGGRLGGKKVLTRAEKYQLGAEGCAGAIQEDAPTGCMKLTTN